MGNKKRCFVLDMDGTFYLGDKLIEGSFEFIEHIEKTGCRYVFYTNNSSKNASDYVVKLRTLGLNASNDMVITSGMVTIKFIKDMHPASSVYLLGTPELVREFNVSGIKLTEENPDIVVVGFDTTLTYDKLSKACGFIRNGGIFLATHPDFNCPTESGFIPDCGAICAFITASTGAHAKSLGKPNKETLQYLLDHFKCAKDEMVFVGDRLYTDIAIGFNNGITSVLVLSGETKLTDIEKSSIKPTFVVNRLFDLIDLMHDMENI